MELLLFIGGLLAGMGVMSLQYGRPSEERFDRLEKILEIIQLQGVDLMALSQESKALIAKFDAHTTRLAELIKTLLDNPSTSEAEFRAALQPIADNLEKIGHDPANPLPTV